MNASYSEAVKEAFALAGSGDVIVNTIELVCSGGLHEESIYLVSQLVDFKAKLAATDTVPTTFTAAPFEFKLPETSDSGRQELEIQIDNVDRSISDFVERCTTMNQHITIVYRAYLDSDRSQPQIEPPMQFDLAYITMDDFKVNARAVFGNFINEPFPTRNYSRHNFPALGS